VVDLDLLRARVGRDAAAAPRTASARAHRGPERAPPPQLLPAVVVGEDEPGVGGFDGAVGLGDAPGFASASRSLATICSSLCLVRFIPRVSKAATGGRRDSHRPGSGFRGVGSAGRSRSAISATHPNPPWRCDGYQRQPECR